MAVITDTLHQRMLENPAVACVSGPGVVEADHIVVGQDVLPCEVGNCVLRPDWSPYVHQHVELYCQASGVRGIALEVYVDDFVLGAPEPSAFVLLPVAVALLAVLRAIQFFVSQRRGSRRHAHTNVVHGR